MARKSVLAVGLLAATLSSGVAIASPVIEESCGPALKSSSPTLQNAFSNLYSFHHVLHSFNRVRSEVSEPTYCVSGLALSRNAFQNVQYYIQIDVRSKGEAEPRHRFRFLYQDASVQAYHNVQGQPWVGLMPTEVESVFAKLVGQSRFEAAKADSADPVEVAKQSATYKSNASEVDERTLSSLVVKKDLNQKTYLVSWLTRPPANPYVGAIRTLGVLVSVSNDGTATLAENVAVSSDVLFPLANLRESMGPVLPAKSGWTDLLFDLSKH